MKTVQVKTPCISVCEMDAQDMCKGCYRTVHEIRNWRKYTESEREIIVSLLPSRSSK